MHSHWYEKMWMFVAMTCCFMVNVFSTDVLFWCNNFVHFKVTVLATVKNTLN